MRWYYKLTYRIMSVYWKLINPITVGVRLLMVKEDTIILVRPTYLESWYLPGGGLKGKETLEQAIRREAAEEVGGILYHLTLLGVYSSFFEAKSDHIIVFVSEDFSLTTQSNRNEIEQFQAFEFDHLPTTISPGTKRRIEEYHQGKGPYYGNW